MTTQDNLSSETLASTAHVDALDGGETVASPALSLSDLNSYLGSDFKDTATALKALKDTQSYVGKKKEDVAAEIRASAPAQSPAIDESLKLELQSIKNEMFYSAHPEFSGYKTLIAKMGGSPAEVTGSEEFKSIFEKVKIADEAVQKRSVVSSSSRLGEAKTATQDAIALANSRGVSTADVAMSLAKSMNSGL
jgi:hypothetical protein